MVAASATKKTATKSALGAKSTEKATHHATHPSWIDMITECITTTPDGTRQGVSRPTIKKYVDSKYHLPINATSTSQLNRAITHGAGKGNFVLPKGPSGKVKLAPKRLGGGAKENTRPPSKRPATAKDEPTPGLKAKTIVKKQPRPATKTRAAPVSEERTTPPKAAAAARKYTSAAKKAHVTTAPGRKVPTRKATTKRGGAKRAVTGVASKKPRTAAREPTRRTTRSATK